MTTSNVTGATSGLHRAVVVRRRRLRTYTGRMLVGAVLPGSGLMLSGRTRVGGTILAFFMVVVIALAAGAVLIGPAKAVLLLASRPALLLIVAVVLATLALIAVGTLIWTADINWPSPARFGKKLLAVLLAAVLILGILAPTARALQYVFITSNLMNSVFATGPGGRLGLGLTGDPWDSVPRVNVLLVGSDAEPDRPGLRTDSIMMASIDTQTGDTLLISIPRNLENIPFPSSSPLTQVWPDGFDCGDKCLLNEVWNEGEEHAYLYPGDPTPGLTALEEAVTAITGLTPDYSAVVNMEGFQALVNAMGGVTINVQQRVPIGGKVENGEIVPGSIKGWIEPGVQHLDGYHALWYARGRATTDDFDRMGRQRCMVGAVINQVDPQTMVERFPQIAQVVNEHVYTDVPQEHLPAWADLVGRIQQGSITSLSLNNKLIHVTDPDYQHVQQMVQASIFGQPLPTPTYTDGRETPRAFRATPTKTPSPERTEPEATPGEPTSDSFERWGDNTTTPQPTPTPEATSGLVDVAAAC